jgi:putative ABC transport system permease protein
MGSFVQDLRYALRSLRKQPGFTAIAVACLALGIGANTAIFSVVRTVLLGSLPYREPARLVRIYETFTAQGKSGLLGSVSVPNLTDFRAQSTSFDGLAAYNGVFMNLVDRDQPERLRVNEVTANAFALLGTPPLAGRVFRADEDAPGSADVVVISEGFWRRRFGSRPEIINTTVRLDSTTFTVVGVMPGSFDLPVSAVHTDAWTLFRPERNGDAKNRGAHFLQVFGRLRPGVDAARADADLKTAVARIATVEPGEMEGRSATTKSMEEVLVGSVRPALLLLLGAVGLVLLIACANVANLLLARASGRRREVAIRTALGADPRRIVRQFLTESILLSAAGGVLGLAVAFGSLRVILSFAATSLPRAEAVGLDPLVLAFTAAVSIVTGIAFGLVPALQASRADLRQDLSDSSGKTSISGVRHRGLKALVVAEIALSMVLLTGAGLLVRSFGTLVKTDPGLQAHNVLTFKTRLATSTELDSTLYVRFAGPVLEKLRALPGVRAAGTTSLLPVQSWGTNGNMSIVGRPVETDQSKRPYAEFRTVSSGYFAALGIPMRAGREFNDHDVPGALPPIIVNQEFARRYFPGEDPLGKQINAWSSTPYTIVGVAGDVRQAGLDQDPRSEVYVNAAFNPTRLTNITFVVSTAFDPARLVPSVRDAVAAVSPGQPLYGVETMESVIGSSLRRRELTLVLLAVLAALAVALAGAGIYGVMSYLVTQRTRELGIRMALGASARGVTTMVLSDAMKLAGAGVAIGLVAALALSGVMQSLLFGIGARDPITLLASSVLLPAIAVGSSLVPALRAARADPLTAIRAE